ncbi:MAG: hypothetical protein H6Q90_4858 [Deltaproteobacteria bacterium]|nr:hypothetical protein [Deltaproteobacteria bacterium]
MDATAPSSGPRFAWIVLTTLGLVACARRPAPTGPSERVLVRDLERQVTVAATTGWGVDRVEVEGLLDSALDSVCRVDPMARRAVLSWLDSEILRRGGPVETAWRERGKKLSRVDDLLVLSRMRLVLAHAEDRAGDCPFWLEPELPFRGRQVSEHRFQVSFGAGGKGIVVQQGDRFDVNFGGAGRLLFGRMFEHGHGLYLGAELGGSAAFPKDASGTRSALVIGADLVTPLVYRHTFTNSYVELETGWLGHATEQDWAAIDHGFHFGVAFGARAMRTRFLFPGAALGVSWERTLLDGDDLTTIKIGARVAFDLDL